MGDFIRSNIRWVDKTITDSVLQGNDHDIITTLNQIHRVSLLEGNRGANKSYKEALLTKEGITHQQMVSIHKPLALNPTLQWERNTLFIGNLPHNVQLKELWKIFKQVGRIKDIILPKRTDILGRRYGFVKVLNGTNIERLIRSVDEVMINSKTIRVNRARRRKYRSTPQHSENILKNVIPNKNVSNRERRDGHRHTTQPTDSYQQQIAGKSK